MALDAQPSGSRELPADPSPLSGTDVVAVSRLFKYRTEIENTNTAIVRLEQFYPYPSKHIRKIFEKYSSLKKLIWVQEEPKNMGAWNFLNQRLRNDLPDDCELVYVGRSESASPAVGSYKISMQHQKKLVKDAFS